MNLNNAVDSILSKYSKSSPGRPPTGKNPEIKAYNRISISLTDEQKLKIKTHADQEFQGNISYLIKSLLKEKGII